MGCLGGSLDRYMLFKEDSTTVPIGFYSSYLNTPRVNGFAMPFSLSVCVCAINNPHQSQPQTWSVTVTDFLFFCEIDESKKATKAS